MSEDVIFLDDDEDDVTEDESCSSESEVSDSSQEDTDCQESAPSPEIMVIDLVSDSDNSDACDSLISDEGDDEPMNGKKIEPTNGTKAEPRRKVSKSSGSSEQNQRASSKSNKSEQNEAPETNNEKVDQNKKKKKKKKPKGEDLSNAASIVKSILDDSQFKVPNLSKIVMEKFNSPNYKGELKRQLKAISYKDTVRSSHVDGAILPLDYKYYKVNVDPFAITSLARVEKPVDQWKRNKGTKVQKKKTKDEKKEKSPAKETTKQTFQSNKIDQSPPQAEQPQASPDEDSGNLDDRETSNQKSTGNKRNARRKRRRARLLANAEG